MKFLLKRLLGSLLLKPTRTRNKSVLIATALIALVAFLVMNPPSSLSSALSSFTGSTNSFSVRTDSKVISGKVIKVIDGDTIDVLDSSNTKHRIRFHGIDAPEKKQAYGQKAREFLASMIAGQNVKVIVMDQDRYNRIVGKIMLGNTDINREMVANGYAHAYTQYSKDYVAEEADAKSFKLGLWQDKHPIKPSDFRRVK